MPQKLAGVSDSAVKKATGKSWSQWVTLIDKKGGRDMTHRQIVNMLQMEGHIASGWWSQMVTVGYEYARGRRVVGETKGAGFQIGVQKTLPISREKAWELMTKAKGRHHWLGRVSRIKFKSGERFSTSDGTTGEIRTIDPGKKIRLTWKPKNWKQSSTLQITLLSGGPEKTAIRFHQERLPGARRRDQMRQHWQEVLGRLAEVVAGK